MSVGDIIDKSIKCRSHEFGCLVFYFKRVCFAPRLLCSLVADRTEAPIPCTAFKRFVRIIHTPLFGSRYGCFCIRKAFRLRIGKLKFVSGLHGLRHDKRSWIDIEFIIRFRVWLFTSLVVQSIRGFHRLFGSRIGCFGK